MTAKLIKETAKSLTYVYYSYDFLSCLHQNRAGRLGNLCLEFHRDVQKRTHRGMDGYVALLATSCTAPGCCKPSSFSLQNFAGSSEQIAACSEAFLMPLAVQLLSQESTQAPSSKVPPFPRVGEPRAMNHLARLTHAAWQVN